MIVGKCKIYLENPRICHHVHHAQTTITFLIICIFWHGQQTTCMALVLKCKKKKTGQIRFTYQICHCLSSCLSSAGLKKKSEKWFGSRVHSPTRQHIKFVKRCSLARVCGLPPLSREVVTFPPLPFLPSTRNLMHALRLLRRGSALPPGGRSRAADPKRRKKKIPLNTPLILFRVRVSISKKGRHGGK
jgi:hypothetical protein